MHVLLVLSHRCCCCWVRCSPSPPPGAAAAPTAPPAPPAALPLPQAYVAAGLTTANATVVSIAAAEGGVADIRQRVVDLGLEEAAPGIVAVRERGGRGREGRKRERGVCGRAAVLPQLHQRRCTPAHAPASFLPPSPSSHLLPSPPAACRPQRIDAFHDDILAVERGFRSAIADFQRQVGAGRWGPRWGRWGATCLPACLSARLLP